MKYIPLFILLYLTSCSNTGEGIQQVHITNNSLSNIIYKFITKVEFTDVEKNIIVSSVIIKDTTVLYLTGDMKADKKNVSLQGYTVINGVYIWFQGDPLKDFFLKRVNNKFLMKETSRQNEVFDIKMSHPLQWEIAYKGDRLLYCKSNKGNCN